MNDDALHVKLAAEFGTVLADGTEALAFRHRAIDPYIDLCERVVLDFTGVRTANSSFTNALVSGIVEHHGEAVLGKLVFKGCNPVVQVLVEAAIDLGLRKIAGRIDA